MAAGGAVRVDEDDEVVGVGEGGFESSEVDLLAGGAIKGEAVHGAADDAFEDVGVFAVGTIKDQDVRSGREPVAKGAEDQVG